MANTVSTIRVHLVNQKNVIHTNLHPSVCHHHSVDKPTLPSAWNSLGEVHMFSVDTQHDAKPDTVHTELLQIDPMLDPAEGYIWHT